MAVMKMRHGEMECIMVMAASTIPVSAEENLWETPIDIRGGVMSSEIVGQILLERRRKCSCVIGLRLQRLIEKILRNRGGKSC
ncbi:hypothetical protein Tco_0093452 [Tanacetum coccineum]